MHFYSLPVFFFSSLLVTRALEPRGPIDTLLFFASLFCAHIIATGFVLSALRKINYPEAWAVASSVLLIACWIAIGLSNALRNKHLSSKNTGNSRLRQPSTLLSTLGCEYRRFLNLFDDLARQFMALVITEKLLVVLPVITFLVLSFINFGLAIITAPHNWDSMTYHLARMAYYLQFGSLDAYDANYWAQVTHPKNATILFIYSYLVSGRNENFIQLVQFISYWIGTIAVYGICRRLERDRLSSLITACIFALLTEILMQAKTTQNDMIATALVAIIVYMLYAYRESGQIRYTVVGSLSAGILLGIKASVLLAIPSLVAIALCVILVRREYITLISLPVTTLVASLLFAVPSGYFENQRMFGNPIGPENVRVEHSFESAPLDRVVAYGTRNLARYSFEFLSLDGMPGIVTPLQRILRRIPNAVVNRVGLDLQASDATRARFSFYKGPTSHEDGSYWGVFGFALIWPLALLTLLGIVKFRGARVLSVAAVLFVLVQAYSGPYDPWRGRYFIIAAVFAVPLAARFLLYQKNPILRAYLLLIMILGCFSAFTAVLLRSNDRPWETLSMNRVEQITRNRRDYMEPIRRFEERVPRDATVALFLGGDTFEYPLFGEGLTRKLIPLNSFIRGPKPVPTEADFLLYSSKIFKDSLVGDIPLGQDWYLRKLGT